MLSFLAFFLTILTLILVVFQVLYVIGYQRVIESSVEDSKGAAAINEGDSLVAQSWSDDCETVADVDGNRTKDEARITAHGTAPHGIGLGFDSLATGLTGSGSGRWQPPAAVVLCLRGSDDTLVETLSGLVGQDYPEFQLFIVIDSPDDPAVETVEAFFSTLTCKPTVEYLEHRPTTCSLKCAAQTQAVESIPSRFQVIAFLDADAAPDEHWLTDLVSPLEDSSIGATTGNRWYTPDTLSLGGLVRRIWNAAAVVQMQHYRIPWGGSMALRLETIERCDLVSHWRKCFCEDTSLIQPLKKQRLVMYRVPDLVIENREAASVKEAFNFITRQMLTVRLHHNHWPLVVGHAVVTGLATIVAPIVILLMLVVGHWTHLTSLLQAVVAYQVINALLLTMVAKSNHQILDDRDQTDRLNGGGKVSLFWSALATFITQLIYPFAVLKAAMMKRVVWRDVEYAVGRNGVLTRLGESNVSGNAQSELPAEGSRSDSARDKKSGGAQSKEFTSFPITGYRSGIGGNEH